MPPTLQRLHVLHVLLALILLLVESKDVQIRSSQSVRECDDKGRFSMMVSFFSARHNASYLQSEDCCTFRSKRPQETGL